jgi:hypothetical protein
MARLVRQLQQQQSRILKRQQRVRRLFLQIKRLKREQRCARALHLKRRARDMLADVQRLRGRLESMCVDMTRNRAIVAAGKAPNERVLSTEDMDFAVKMIAIVDPVLIKIESVVDRLRGNGARVLQMRDMPRGVTLSLCRNETTVTKLSATMVKLERSVQTLGRVVHGLGT